MSQFSKEELSFVKEVPEQIEIECPVCLHILTDPHQVTCCGHNFCGSCIERVKASNGSCPMYKEEEYQSFIDKKCSRIINGLEVYCSNRKNGCQWKGELKNMSTHLNKEKREGECQYEEVKCQYEECQERYQRRYLKYHEDKECSQRLVACYYCRSKGTFLSITKDHFEECSQYPVTCPNKCVSTNIPRGSLTAHINKCPLEPVDCVFSWAGCNDKPLRKDVHEHTADTKHMTLLAVACGQLKKENEQIKEENEQIKEENEKIKEENGEIKEEVKAIKEENDTIVEEVTNLKVHVHYAIADDSYPLLPTHIDVRGEAAAHFYTSACGRLMSARIMVTKDNSDFFMLFAFHEGKFDKFHSKLPKVNYYSQITGTQLALLDGTETTYIQLPHDALNSVVLQSGSLYAPPGVIVRKLHILFDIAVVHIF